MPSHPSSRPTAHPSITNPAAPPTASIRRNLFPTHLHRRPHSASTSTSTTATTIHESQLSPNTSASPTSEIVVRHQNGEYAVVVPGVPPEEEGKTNSGDGGALGGEEVETTESESILFVEVAWRRKFWGLEARLLEMYRNRTRQSGEPAELLMAVQSSLRRKVASLEEDRWMFEAEKGSTG